MPQLQSPQSLPRLIEKIAAQKKGGKLRRPDRFYFRKKVISV
jgi:hypothetical protein